MKVIRVDNFDREILGRSDDELVAEHVPAQYAEVIAAALNEKLCPRENDEYHFKVVSDDYVPCLSG